MHVFILKLDPKKQNKESYKDMNDDDRQCTCENEARMASQNLNAHSHQQLAVVAQPC